MADATTLEDGNWVTFEKTIDMATIIQDGQTLYDVLAPYQNQVFLRYHYFDADGVSYDEEHSYYITDVSFKPVPQIDSIQLSETNKTVELGWRGAIGCTISGNVEATGYIRWTSSDPNIIEIDSETGRMIAKSVGNTNIFAISKENLVVYSVCNITVTGPQVFGELVKSNAIELSDIKKTNDGFYLCSASMYSILKKEYSNVGTGYDEYFIFAVKDTDETYEYGLIKYVTASLNAGSSVSFVDFNGDLLIKALNIHTEETKNALVNEIDKVFISKEDVIYSQQLQTYFSNPASKGSYTIAEEYIKLVVKKNYYSENNIGYVDVPNEYISILNERHLLSVLMSDPLLDNQIYLSYANRHTYLSRVPLAVANKNVEAGANVYDYDKNRILIVNPNNLTTYEKYIILMTHTGNVTFNSFAAEVVAHADGVTKHNEDGLLGFYYRYLRADMIIKNTEFREVLEPYFNLTSDIVQEQIYYHGEK